MKHCLIQRNNKLIDVVYYFKEKIFTPSQIHDKPCIRKYNSMLEGKDQPSG